MEYEFYDHTFDPLMADYVAKCDFPGCEWSTKIKLHPGVGLKIGDLVYLDPENETFGRCMKCKRHSLRIIMAPETAETAKPKGFWRIPTE